MDKIKADQASTSFQAILFLPQLESICAMPNQSGQTIAAKMTYMKCCFCCCCFYQLCSYIMYTIKSCTLKPLLSIHLSYGHLY